MAIVGLTHDSSGELENKVTKYRGKISSGWGPKEGPNKGNFPMAAGHYLAMSETVKNKRIGDKIVPVTKWELNKDIQAKIEAAANGSKTPRMLEIVSLYKSPEDMWDSFLAKYSQSEGLMCRGNGIGTEASYLEFDDDGNRLWKKKPCGFDRCPDYISGACKANGVMKVYPTVDTTPPNPYKFETRSLNTIRNIESALNDIWNLVKTAHAVKELEAGHELPFDGMFGLKMYLVHKKKKSGGRDVFVSEIVASKEFRDNIMKVINRAIDHKSETAGLIGDAGNVSLLDTAASVMIDHEDDEVSEVIAIEAPDAAMEVDSRIDADALEAANAAMKLMEED